MLTASIKKLSQKYYEKMVESRHLFHMNPEIAFQEFETAKYLANELRNMGISVEEGLAQTGVVGLIEGNKPGKTILLRADMDALEIEEENDIPFKSTVKGKMHACGHDGHMAGVLGAAMILNDLKDQLNGNVKIVFQPAEEADGGAKPMIDESVLENPQVNAAIGCHLWGEFNEGEVHVKEGPTMASIDVFTFQMIGKGGHAALPHLSIDPVVMGAKAVSDIQTIVSRKVDPLQPAVVSCCSIHGGETFNVIPNTVEVKGTVRTFNEEIRGQIQVAIEDVLKAVALEYGGSYKLEYTRRFPPLINNEDMVGLARKSISKLIGENNVHQQAKANMGGEDFAYFAKAIPSVYYFIGITPENSDTIIHHHPKFNFNDENLLLLSQSMAQIAIDYLNENK